MLRAVILFCVLGVVLSGPPLARTREQIQAFRNALERSRRGRYLYQTIKIQDFLKMHVKFQLNR